MSFRLFRPYEYSQLSASGEENIEDEDTPDMEQKSIPRASKSNVWHVSTQTLLGLIFTVVILSVLAGYGIAIAALRGQSSFAPTRDTVPQGKECSS